MDDGVELGRVQPCADDLTLWFGALVEIVEQTGNAPGLDIADPVYGPGCDSDRVIAAPRRLIDLRASKNPAGQGCGRAFH